MARVGGREAMERGRDPIARVFLFSFFFQSAVHPMLPGLPIDTLNIVKPPIPDQDPSGIYRVP